MLMTMMILKMMILIQMTMAMMSMLMMMMMMMMIMMMVTSISILYYYARSHFGSILEQSIRFGPYIALPTSPRLEINMSGAASSASGMNTPVAKGMPRTSLTPTSGAKIPSPKPTGDEDVDEQRQGEVDLLQEIVDGCMEHREIIVAMHSSFKKKMERITCPSRIIASADESFKAKTLEELWKMYPDWIINYVVCKSGLTQDQVTKSMKSLPNCPLLLFKYHLQLESVPLDGVLAIKAVFWEWSDARGRMVGDRLVKFVSNGGHIDSNCVITFPKACYFFTKGEGIYKTVTHRPTNVTKDISALKIPSEHVYNYNWLDIKTSITPEGLPSIKVLTTFFKTKGEGPRSYGEFKPGGAEWEDGPKSVCR